jgi:hypothetical protein
MWKLALNRKRLDRPDTARVKALVVDAFGGNTDIGVSANEIICNDPGCPGTETVILVMVPGRKTAACKVQKAMADVTDDDVRDALKSLSYTP